MFEEIFTLVLNEGIDSGYVKPEVIFVDSTHIKANANRKKQMKVHVPKAVKTLIWLFPFLQASPSCPDLRVVLPLGCLSSTNMNSYPPEPFPINK